MPGGGITVAGGAVYWKPSCGVIPAGPGLGPKRERNKKMTESSIHHVVLNTGRARRARLSEVKRAVIDVVDEMLARALAGKRTPIPTVTPACYLTATGDGSCLVATVWNQESATGAAPLATIGVAGSADAAARLWRSLHGRDASGRLDTDPHAVPGSPWCATRFEVEFQRYPKAREWLEDFSRCLAWTWVERHVGTGSVSS